MNPIYQHEFRDDDGACFEWILADDPIDPSHSTFACGCAERIEPHIDESGQQVCYACGHAVEEVVVPKSTGPREGR